MKKRMLVFVLVCLLLPGLAEPITQEDMITIAAEAIAFKWGEEPELLDESKWQLHIFSQPDKQSPQWEIWFEPMEVALNGYALVITQDGRVIEARMQPGTGNPAIPIPGSGQLFHALWAYGLLGRGNVDQLPD